MFTGHVLIEIEKDDHALMISVNGNKYVLKVWVYSTVLEKMKPPKYQVFFLKNFSSLKDQFSALECFSVWSINFLLKNLKREKHTVRLYNHS